MTDITCIAYVGLLYTYLADCAGKRGKEGAFRELCKEDLLTGHLADLQSWRLTYGILTSAMYGAK